MQQATSSRPRSMALEKCSDRSRLHIAITKVLEADGCHPRDCAAGVVDRGGSYRDLSVRWRGWGLDGGNGPGFPHLAPAPWPRSANMACAGRRSDPDGWRCSGWMRPSMLPRHPRHQLHYRHHRCDRQSGTSARLPDVVDDRSASALARWMHQRAPQLAGGDRDVALDPYSLRIPYRYEVT